MPGVPKKVVCRDCLMEYRGEERGSIGVFLRDSKAPPNFGKGDDDDDNGEGLAS